MRFCKGHRRATERRRIRARIKRLEERLDYYLERERKILDGGVRSYGIGSRNLTRYEADLGDVRAAIRDIENQIDALEAQLCGSGARGTRNVVERDW